MPANGVAVVASDIAWELTYSQRSSTPALGEDTVEPSESPNPNGALLPSGIIGIHLTRFVVSLTDFPEPGFL